MNRSRFDGGEGGDNSVGMVGGATENVLLLFFLACLLWLPCLRFLRSPSFVPFLFFTPSVFPSLCVVFYAFQLSFSCSVFSFSSLLLFCLYFYVSAFGHGIMFLVLSSIVFFHHVNVSFLFAFFFMCFSGASSLLHTFHFQVFPLFSLFHLTKTHISFCSYHHLLFVSFQLSLYFSIFLSFVISSSFRQWFVTGFQIFFRFPSLFLSSDLLSRFNSSTLPFSLFAKVIICVALFSFLFLSVGLSSLICLVLSLYFFSLFLLFCLSSLSSVCLFGLFSSSSRGREESCVIAAEKCSRTGLSDAVARGKKVVSDGQGDRSDVDTVGGGRGGRCWNVPIWCFFSS